MNLPAPAAYNMKQSRILSDHDMNLIGSQLPGVRASKSRWDWLGRSVKYTDAAGETCYLNRNSAVKYLERHHVVNPHKLKNADIVRLVDEVQNTVEINDYEQNRIHTDLFNSRDLWSIKNYLMAQNSAVDLGSGRSAAYDHRTNTIVLNNGTGDEAHLYAPYGYIHEIISPDFQSGDNALDYLNRFRDVFNAVRTEANNNRPNFAMSNIAHMLASFRANVNAGGLSHFFTGLRGNCKTAKKCGIFTLNAEMLFLEH